MAYAPNFNDPIYGFNAPSVDPRQTGGILSGQQSGGGPLAGDWQGQLRQFLDPQYALPIAAQLIGGANPQASLAGAFGAAGQAIPDMKRRVAMNAYLKAHSGLNLTPDEQQLLQSDPELGRAFIVRQLTPKPPITVGAGDRLYDPASGQFITPPGGGGYGGTSMDAQNWNIILQGKTDTPEYAAAYNQLFQTPKMASGTGPNNEITQTPYYPEVPPGVKPPTGAGAITAPPAAPAAPGEPPAVAAPAAAGGPRVGTPIVTGKAKPPELVIKNRQLYSVVSKELPIAQANFDALTKLGNQAAAAGGTATQWLASPEYQQAISSINTIVSSYLYSVSGQTANPGEVKTLVASLQPFPGESEASIANKKARLETMVRGVQIAANGGEVPDNIKAKAEDKGGGAPARPASVPAGSAYSPSRKMWKTPDGAHLFDEQGTLVQ